MAISSMISFGDLLYTLAPEIRNEIYGYVFFSSGDRINTSVRNTKHYLALIRTCKQYHQEAASFFYTQSTFNFGSFAIRLAHQVPISTVLSPISNRYLHFLKRVILDSSVGASSLSDTRLSANLISALTRTGAQFRTVCINLTLGRYLEPSLTKIFEDGILDSNHCIVSALLSLLHSNACKRLQVHIRGCYFAPGIASRLFETFEHSIGVAKDRELSFWNGDERLGKDLSAFEHEMTGNLYHSLFQDFYLRDGDDEASDERSDECSKSSDAVTFAEIVDLNLDHDLDLAMDEDEDEAAGPEPRYRERRRTRQRTQTQTMTSAGRHYFDREAPKGSKTLLSLLLIFSELRQKSLRFSNEISTCQAVKAAGHSIGLSGISGKIRKIKLDNRLISTPMMTITALQSSASCKDFPGPRQNCCYNLPPLTTLVLDHRASSAYLRQRLKTDHRSHEVS